MFHQKRTWSITKVSTIDELARNLYENTWDTFTGFDLEGVLYLNDSFCENSAQEYAVVVKEDNNYFQIESITFSWLNGIDLVWGAISKMQSQHETGKYNFYLPVEVHLDQA